MGRPKSLRSKAAHFVIYITTGLLNPISDKPSKPSPFSSSCKKMWMGPDEVKMEQ
ncbi:hypothetical protein RchiOBHm_Chr2g0114321 [Rosa chinensis]|uniref:Uncharacterized protein n=1 Tax=Rosa chinensis TaxID=74649 RepID=A0A2P6RQS4_ROSCH|nr:hypothetical protein RchiOBHm_Chr2g0114321 [Rosa chinensis]